LISTTINTNCRLRRLPIEVPDGVVSVFGFFENSGHREGHQTLGSERQVEGERRRVVQRLRKVFQKREDAQTT
jgi:hypothetical protein